MGTSFGWSDDEPVSFVMILRLRVDSILVEVSTHVQIRTTGRNAFPHDPQGTTVVHEARGASDTHPGRPHTAPSP